MYGLVKWFQPQKGMGLIECLDGAKVLFRSGDLQPRNVVLRAGDEVAFEIDNSHLVPRARHVICIRQEGKAA